MRQRRQGFGNKMNARPISDRTLKKASVNRRSDREQKFVSCAQSGRRFQDRRQVHFYFFYSAARHECDPWLGGIESQLRGTVLSRDGWVLQVSQGMPDEGCIHAAI